MILLSNNKHESLVNRIEELAGLVKVLEDSSKVDRIIVPGASSVQDYPESSFNILGNIRKILTPEFDFEVIQIIRDLTKVNPDLNQVFNDTVKLANTGHRVFFDPKVEPDQIDAMRNYLIDSSKHWHTGAGGINQIVNKIIRQLLIGGANSTEWIPDMKLERIEKVRFLYPDRIRFKVLRGAKGYHPYQYVKHKDPLKTKRQLKKLNTNTFKYVALNGDTDLPYGIPPYMAAMEPIATQSYMTENIKTVVKMLCILCYLEALIEKPFQDTDESDAAYKTRLTNLLNDTKTRVMSGFRDGASVGFKDDHQFDFKQTTTNARGVADLFEQNELQLASALNWDPAFLGRPGSSESLVTVLFTKMLSQLTNYQDIVAETLEFGYKLALQLGGFKFETLRIEFNKSTLTDDLKFQQAEEIKLRNLVAKYKQGIIGQEQFADEAGYAVPDQEEPRQDPAMEQQAEIDRQGREADKDASDRAGRDKKAPQGKVNRTVKNIQQPYFELN